MKPVIRDFPRRVRSVENIFIPMPGGHRLAARLWLPDDAEKAPVPAIIEYMPYRKRDHSRGRDAAIHHYLAGHGYAGLRIDTRGSGDSDGVLRGEWREEELQDGIDAIAWIARQKWCSGKVGMIGKSWSGFTALALAGRAPPALKAIVPVCAGDDRYHQSLHWTGGCFLVEQLWWADSMVMFNMRPPDPAIVGERWQAMWRERLDDNHPWLIDWLSHQRRDEFWKHASLCEHYAETKAAVFAVGGWADYISRAVPRLMANLPGPRFALVGPWGHHYPHDGIPGPAVGFLQDCVRFFDRYVKGTRNGWEKAPSYRAFLQAFETPSRQHTTRAGRWIGLAGWPSKRVKPRVFHLNPGRLDAKARPETTLNHRSPLSIGLGATEWLSMGVDGEQPGDQREDDARALAFDSAPFETPIDLLGQVGLDLEIAVNRPVAQLIARLCDVAPDGTSVRIAFQALNLTHRNSHEAPAPMTPGERTRIHLDLPDVGWSVAPGHRLRLALSTSYWPIIWPAPEPFTLTLFTGQSRMTLPVLAAKPGEIAPSFAPPERAPEIVIEIVTPGRIQRRLLRDLMTGETTIETIADGKFLGPARRWRIAEIGTVIGHTMTKRVTIGQDDPISARTEYVQTYELEREDWRIRLETRLVFRATRTHWIIEQEAAAFEGNATVSKRNWRKEIPRDLM